jgi:hypothetical protein
MNIKISILILFLILSINNVSGEFFSDTWIESSTTNEIILPGGSGYYTGYNFGIGDFTLGDAAQLRNMKLYTLKIPNIYVDTTKDSEYNGVNFKIGAVYVGSGLAGYNVGSNYTFVHYWFQDLDLSGYSGLQVMTVEGVPTSISTGNYYKDQTTPTNQQVYKRTYNPGRSEYYGWRQTTHDIQMSYTFENIINVDFSSPLSYVETVRDDGNQSMYNITQDSIQILYEDDFLTGTNITYSDSLSSFTITGINSYGDLYSKVFTSSGIPGETTLTTDKTYYNTSENITISYTNIDKIYDDCTSSFCDEAYQMWIYAIDPIENIPKYRNWLYSDRRDETFVLNTSFLLPQTTYKLVITSGEVNVMIESDIFYVYPDNEYLSVSCGIENNCYTYNNADITIYYKIDNNSDIIIKDNDNNIINTYHNIIDSGEILYHIPDDLNHINTYPNWKIYLNNTGYSTSFNKGITVYWSQFQTPTPTPTYTPSPTPDINISDTIDEFKTETQPIKDLIFGLSEIVIDNPDYNKDNIVDESEINHWFNSLIPICIIFLLVVLYIGLKKKRE